MLSNLVLDELDQEQERVGIVCSLRGRLYIYVRSERAGRG